MRRMQARQVKSSVLPDNHADWSLSGARRAALVGSVERRLTSGRSCRLFLNGRAAHRIEGADLEAIEAIVCEACDPKPEGRSKSIQLRTPLRTYGRLRLSRPVVSLQLKGVMLDRTGSLRSYGGVGFCADYYFADSDAVFQRFDSIADPIGGCTLAEALREYSYGLGAYPRLAGGLCEIPMPVGWGIYDDLVWEGQQLGFVILGLPALPEAREGAYHAAVARLHGEGDFAPLDRLLRRRGSAMRAMHDAGFLMPFRHFLNLSFAGDFVLMHDLGDRRAVFRSQLADDDQFYAEAFCNLTYAMTPDEHLPVRAPRSRESAEIILAHLDRVTTATIEGYFGACAAELPFTFNAVEEAFQDAFDIPFGRSPHPVAVAYRRLLSNGVTESTHAEGITLSLQHA